MSATRFGDTWSPAFTFLCLLLLVSMAEGRDSRSTDEIIVSTHKGRVRGTRYHFPDSINKAVDVFLGIPFAKPPLGNLRFRHPQPVDAWDGLYDATQLPNSCYQEPDMFFGDFAGSVMWNPNTAMSEDCLYLNVWVPATRPRIHNAAVMVWIYGGAFNSGTPTLDIYDGKILAAVNDVIVVSIAYRVGALGFLTLNTAGAPGNAGLFDQHMGLEWVQQNIRNFGGDPQSVTLFGESAGAISVGLHLLSPFSMRKFQRAIMQSGSANMKYVLTATEGKRRSMELAYEHLGCQREGTLDELLECLRHKDASEIVDNQGAIQLLFLPVIDGTFILDAPDDLLRQQSFKKCPILMGSNLNEGSYFLVYELPDYLGLRSQTMDHDQFLASIGELFRWYPQYPETANQYVMDAIVFQYSDWLNPDNMSSNIANLDKALGDSRFTCKVNYFALEYARAGEDVFMYHFTHRYSSNPWPSWMGVLHADEILFVFGEPLKPQSNFTESERELSRQIMRYWTNFAKTGDPNPTPGITSEQHWPLHTPEEREYFELNTQFIDEADQSVAVGQGPRGKECAFWQEYLPDLQAGTELTSSGATCLGCQDVTQSMAVITGVVLLTTWFRTHLI